MADSRKLLVMGASGCGTSTLGRALAERLACAFFDADDFFWLPTMPPFREKRERGERLRMASGAVFDNQKVVLSGSICGWGTEVEQAFDLVVFLTVPTDIRLKRLVAREEARWGRVDPEFLTWAGRYDDGGLEMRSRAMHERWLGSLACPVIRLDGQRPLEELVGEVLRVGLIVGSPSEVA